MVKWFSAAFHLGIGIVHFFEASRIARSVIFKAESSLGEIFRLRVPCLEEKPQGRITLLTDSMALVSEIARRIGYEKANSVMMSGHLARHVLEFVGDSSFQA